MRGAGMRYRFSSRDGEANEEEVMFEEGSDF